MRRLLLLLFLFLGLLVSQLSAQRLYRPDGIFYYQPAASVFGTEATWVNPAKLGAFKASGYQLMAEIEDGDYFKNYGSVVNRQGLGIAYRTLDNPAGDDYKEVVVGIGIMSPSQVGLGVSYTHLDGDDTSFDDGHFWTVALSGQYARNFKYAAIFSNLNRKKVFGIRTETEMRYSLAYRPNNIHLTFSVDMFLSTKTRLSNADFVYHLEYSPIPGLFVNGQIDSDKNFTLGGRVNLLQYFVGNKSAYTKSGNHRRSTLYIGATDLRQPSVIKPKKKRLSLTLKGASAENPPQPVFGKSGIPFLTYLTQLYRAADDPAINSLELRLDRLHLGFAQAQELREALLYFQSKKKPIFCHLSHPNNIGYYIASLADTLAIPPVSQLNLVGLRAELTFYTGLMDKLGIKADMLRIGDHKTAPESFTEYEATRPNREQLERLLDVLYLQFADHIAENRNISTDSVKRIIDKGPYTSVEAVQAKLVDTLMYVDELNDNTPVVSFGRYLHDTLLNDSWYQKPTIAVIVVDDEISFSSGNMNPFSDNKAFTPTKMKKAIRQLSRDSRIAAVLVRIDSPGGDALAGDEIHRELVRLAEKKPLYISFGNTAASGGYYIATPGKHISASPGTFTGSIGIFGGKLVAKNMYEKLAIGKELYTRGEYAGIMSAVRPFTPDERKKYFSQMNALYEHFVMLTAASRELPQDSVNSLGEGRVWLGSEAELNGLIDDTRGVIGCLNTIADELHMDDYSLELYPKERPLFLFGDNILFRSVFSLMRSAPDQSDSTPLDQKLLDSYSGIFTRMPFNLTIQ